MTTGYEPDFGRQLVGKQKHEPHSGGVDRWFRECVKPITLRSFSVGDNKGEVLCEILPPASLSGTRVSHPSVTTRT
jgi:hypothetical protein